MKLWKLSRTDYDYDEYDAFVILANSEEEARQLVSEYDFKNGIWLQPTTKCEQISLRTRKASIVLGSFNAG